MGEATETQAPSEKVAKLLDEIGSLTLFEASELSEAFKDRFNVTAMAPAVAMAAPAAAAGDAGEESDEDEEPTSFNVTLKEIGGQKIQVIKGVRTLTSLGLKEAKALVDGTPNVVVEGVSQEDADKAKTLLEEAGATVEVAGA